MKKLRRNQANRPSKAVIQKSAEVVVPEKLWKHDGGKGRILKAEEFFFSSSKVIRRTVTTQKGS